MRDRFAAANDRVVLAAVFNAIKQISKVTGCVGCSDIGHAIRLSDSRSKVNPFNHADHRFWDQNAPLARLPENGTHGGEAEALRNSTLWSRLGADCWLAVENPA